MKTYDAIIIGAGQAGVPLAKKLAQAGWKTALIEKRFVGGCCVNEGCTPTKTLIASARIAYLVKNSRNWGVNIDNWSIDFNIIKKRKDEIVNSSRDSIEKKLEETELIDLIYGDAEFSGFKELTVTSVNKESERLTADKIFINTGAQPSIPKIEGIESIDYLTSRSILNLDTIPKHLIILGASYIALEFGQLYKRLGSEVTILQQSERILSREDEDVAEEIKEILIREGLIIHTKSEVTRVQKLSNDKIKVQLRIDKEDTQINGTHLLVATGREPQTKTLLLDKTGVEVSEKGYIIVNNKLETNVQGIYALGDVKGGPAFTHISYHDYLIVWKNLLENSDLSSNNIIPYCMFTDPQLGRVGISEMEAKEKGFNYKIAKISMENVARAREIGETNGFMKAIVDLETKKILGAAILGTEGGEIMTVLQMAMIGGITYDQIRYGIFAHPTFSESLNNLFHDY